MDSLTLAFATELDAPRVATLESDFYASQVNQRFQEWDLELFATKWFDYRMMTPLQATKVYIEAYGKVYKEVYAEEFDRERAEYVKPISFDALRAGILRGVTKAKTAFVGCWRGRQIADALTMPYSEYINLAMRYRMRRWKQNYMPKPQHLYHEYDVERIQERWEEMQAGRLYLAEHPAYLNQNFADIRHQNDYHEWLFKQAGLRVSPHQHLAGFIENDQLPYEKVMSRVGVEQFELVKRHLQ